MVEDSDENVRLIVLGLVLVLKRGNLKRKTALRDVTRDASRVKKTVGPLHRKYCCNVLERGARSSKSTQELRLPVAGRSPLPPARVPRG